MINYFGLFHYFYEDFSNSNPTCSIGLARCYNPNCSEYKYYGAIGVIVCVKWLCFEYFLQDLPLIPGYELWKNSTIPREYQLEKDYNQLNSVNFS